MNELSDVLGKSVALTGGALAAAVIALAYILPKLLNGFKGDQLNGNVLERLKAMEDHAAVQDRKMILQDDKIHRYAIKVTKLIIISIRLEGLLVANEIEIPPDLITEIDKLKNETERSDT